MKHEHRAILLALLFGLAVWGLDIVLEFSLLSGMAPLLFLPKILAHAVILVGFLLFGLLVARTAARSRRAEEAERRRAAQLSALQQLGLELVAQLDLETLLRSIVSQGIRLLGGKDGGLYLYREDQDVLERVVSIGNTIPVGSKLRRGEGLSGQVWVTGRPLIVNNYQQWEGRAAVFQNEPNMAVVAAPIRWGEDFLGALNVAADLSHPFSEEDAELLSLLASHAAIAIRNARILSLMDAQRRRAEGLAQATAVLTSTLELENLLENILKAALEAIPTAEKGSILLCDPRSGELCIRALIGYRDERIREARFPREQGYSNWAAREGRPLLIADARADSIRYDGEIEEMRAIQSAIVAPLRFRGQVIGVISLDNASRKGAFAQEELDLLAVFADYAAAAVENARLFEAYRRRHAELEALRQASLHLTSRLELPALLEAILEHVLRLVAADDAHIFLYDGEKFSFGAARWADGRRGSPLSVPRPEGLTYTVARNGQRIVIPNVDEHPLYQDWKWGGAIAGLPLRIGQRVVGVMNVAFFRPHDFQEDELRVLELLADQAAVAIENACLYSDLHRQMERLQSAQVQLVQSARLAAVGELAAGVAHELNNPLTSILGFTELLLEELPLQSPIRADLERIAAESRRARDIVRGLLDFSREARPQKDLADVGEVARRTLNLLRLRLEKRGVVVEEDYAPDLVPVPVDRGQIEQVFWNLLNNALQAMPQGGKLSIRTFREGQEVAVAFSDTGIGISPEVQEHLFEPFFTTYPERAGLGLSISLGIVREHGGRITVESRPGQGSTFTVWLPVGGEGTSSAERTPSPTGKSGGGGS